MYYIIIYYTKKLHQNTGKQKVGSMEKWQKDNVTVTQTQWKKGFKVNALSSIKLFI